MALYGSDGRLLTSPRPMDFGLRARAASDVKAAVRSLLREGLSDQMLHAEIVAAGRTRFREVFARDLGPVFGKHRGPCDDLAEVVYQFFVGQWRERSPTISAALWLDRVVVRSPPTEQEIEDAWEVEIASSDAAMRTLYEGSARTRKGGDLGAKRTKPVLAKGEKR